MASFLSGVSLGCVLLASGFMIFRRYATGTTMYVLAAASGIAYLIIK